MKMAKMPIAKTKPKIRSFHTHWVVKKAPSLGLDQAKPKKCGVLHIRHVVVFADSKL